MHTVSLGTEIALVGSLLLTAIPGTAQEPTQADHHIAAVTVFGCDPDGTVQTASRWNTGPIDAAWDLFVTDAPGEPLSGAAGAPQWYNDPEDHTIRIPLTPGTHRFQVHLECLTDLQGVGLNVFIDTPEGAPAISAFVLPPHDQPGFQVNAATETMGWPITTVPGAGTLDAHLGRGRLWGDCTTPVGHDLACSLTDLRVVASAEAGDPDLVSPHAPTPSGNPDKVLRFTLEVRAEHDTRPNWAAWFRHTAGLDSPILATVPQQPGTPPFSFLVDGVPSTDLLRGLQPEFLGTERIGGTVQTGLVYHLENQDLDVRVESVAYAHHPVLEWTVFLTNRGTSQSALITDLLGADLGFSHPTTGRSVLHHWRGTRVRPDDFEPLTTELAQDGDLVFEPPSGRPCATHWPYFNLEGGDEGILLAVGWPGQWQARFRHAPGAGGIRVTAGQKTTDFRLAPGETARTPRMALLLWRDTDWIGAQNLWRRWMVDHVLPRPGGKLPPVPQLAACSSHQFHEMEHATTENQIQFIRRYLEEGLRLDYWWMDAGWYPNAYGWPNTGTWEVDRSRFPNGLREISDFAHSQGVNALLWFEPERVTAGTWLTENHPDWILGGAAGGLLDLGNPEAWEWLVNHVDRILVDEGIDLYRQDYNIEPLPHWLAADSDERRGLTENFYVQGYLAYWDELLRRHPGMLIDSCASGGHRNDLETMRRSVPLLRSDYFHTPITNQCQTYGLASWLPYYGTAIVMGPLTPYAYRSFMCPHNTACFDMRNPDIDYELARSLVEQWHRIAPYYLEDYYPLLPYDTAEDVWMAWQFHNPDTDSGVVQGFRRTGSVFYGAHLSLRGLHAHHTYRFEDLDGAPAITLTGAEAEAGGLPLEIPERPGAVVIHYRALETQE